MAPPFNVVMRATGEYTIMCVVGESPDTLQAMPQGPSRLALEGRYAFHMCLCGMPWILLHDMHFTSSHSSPNPALAATRLWAGYGELVGGNSISPGKP